MVVTMNNDMDKWLEGFLKYNNVKIGHNADWVIGVLAELQDTNKISLKEFENLTDSLLYGV
jgi:hypothetical protein